MAVRLPQGRTLQTPQSRGVRVPIEQIIAVQGENPYANAINQISPVISQPLQKRAALRREAQSVGAIGKATGMDMTGVKDSQTALSLAQLSALKNYRDGLLNLKGGAGGRRILPQDSVNKIAQADTALAQIGKAKEGYNPSYVGPLQGRLSKLQSVPGAKNIPFVGGLINDPKRAKFNQDLKFGITKFLYSEAGKQLSDQERTFVMEVLNNPNAEDDIFKAQMDNAYDILKEAQSRYKKTLYDSGYRVPGMEEQNSLMSEMEKEGLVTQ